MCANQPLRTIGLLRKITAIDNRHGLALPGEIGSGKENAKRPQHPKNISAVDACHAEYMRAHRSAIMLREFGELSYGEIAEALATNEGCVKAWIYRARKRLAQLLDRDGQYVGTAESNAARRPDRGVSNHDV